MIQTGHGRPLGVFALGVLASLVLLLACASTAAAQDPIGNVVTVAVPRPAGNEIALVRFDATMSRAAARRRLTVRRVGGLIPQRLRASPPCAPASAQHRHRPARRDPHGRGLKRPVDQAEARVGGAGDVFRRTRTRATAIRPGTGIWRRGDCSAIGGEARGWIAVPGLAILNAERRALPRAHRGRRGLGDRVPEATSPSVSQEEADAFLAEADPRFTVEGGGEIEGFYATWTKNADGSGKICVYVRGDWGGSGDL